MSSINTITVEKLNRLIGTPACPTIIDVRTDEQFHADPYLIPGAIYRSHASIAGWQGPTAPTAFVVVCRDGHELSPGAAAMIRSTRSSAEILEGGFDAWKAGGLPLVPTERIPIRHAENRTLWVTRERPKVDRIACPWLIRRFVDRNALFLFVAPSQVNDTAERLGATPFDVEGAFWAHRGERCTFDMMLAEFGLTTKPLLRLAEIVRGADTGRPELSAQVSGLLAISLGLSRMFADDIEQLEAGMLIYDALYRWCRDATAETHNSTPRAAARQDA
jgi:rhodanese-related sulfurtransferase